MISRTTPLPTQGAVTGDLYVARAGATNADMQAILTTVSAAKVVLVVQAARLPLSWAPRSSRIWRAMRPAGILAAVLCAC